MKTLSLVCGVLFFVGCGGNSQDFVLEEEPVQISNTRAVELEDIPNEERELEEVIENEPQCLVFDDFVDQDVEWYAINDNVMGGRSLGYFEAENGVLKFEGSINTNGGGFSSIRSRLPAEILSDFTRVVLEVRGDSRTYEVTFRDANRSRITHRQSFVPSSKTQWQEVSISFEDLTQAFFGQRVQSPAFDKNRALEIGLILSDGQDGPFGLEVSLVSFCE